MENEQSIHVLGKTSRKATATISFTLSISCQICLGKVKDPVCCVNHHVFCKVCVTIWTARNNHCPTCRVEIGSGTGYQELKGGHPLDADEGTGFSDPQIRKARVRALFTSYEEEIDRLNDLLYNQSVELSNIKEKTTHTHCDDTESLNELKDKLNKSTSLYEEIYSQINIYQKEIEVLKLENQHLKRENDTLKYSNSQRSPKKFGRITVATLESQVEKYKTDVQKLEHALQNSDVIIAELEKRVHEQTTRRESDRMSSSLDSFSQQKNRMESRDQRPASASGYYTDNTLSDSIKYTKRNLKAMFDDRPASTGSMHNDDSRKLPHSTHAGREIFTQKSTNNINIHPCTTQQHTAAIHIQQPTTKQQSAVLNSSLQTEFSRKPSLEAVQSLARSQMGHVYETSPVSALLVNRSSTTINSTNFEQPTGLDLDLTDLHKLNERVTPTKRRRDETSSFLDIPSPPKTESDTPTKTMRHLSLDKRAVLSPSKRSKYDQTIADQRASLKSTANPELLNAQHDESCVSTDDTLTQEFNECIELLTKAENRTKNSQSMSDSTLLDSLR